MATADGRSGAATQMTSSEACALMMLAFRLDAGGGRERCRVRAMADTLSSTAPPED